MGYVSTMTGYLV